MKLTIRTRPHLDGGLALCLTATLVATACQSSSFDRDTDQATQNAIDRFCGEQRDRLSDRGLESEHAPGPFIRLTPAWQNFALPQPPCSARISAGQELLTLASFSDEEIRTASQPDGGSATSRPATADAFAAPPGYWRQDIWHQMGHEALSLGGHDFWRGFKTSFWDLENALVLTATMGASITIRGTGVDDAIRRRTDGNPQLGDLDETIQILGNPATHFAGTGVLWLASALAKDVREHEVAKSLTQALAVNGVSTLILKAAANTRAPDGERHAWPSGHTSSSFTAAAVLNEYYGPWVGVPCFALAGLVGYQRIDSRVHDFSDVVFGAALGYVIGTSIARDQKAAFPELFGMQVIPFTDPETGASGLALYKQW